MADDARPLESSSNLITVSSATTSIRTIGHDRLQTIGHLLGRQQRSLASPTMTGNQANSTIIAIAADEPADFNDDRQTLAIAARLSSSGAATPIADENEGFARGLLERCVNLELVRDLIVRHSIGLAIALVILIYLVYYLSRVSRRPKLIGNKQSDFVTSISNNFAQTLRSRFNPLIYFWGTNPQTALFGYLQGQTSNDEMPRSKFHRQYLYVSDAQYLASNIDLSEHYEKCAQRRRHINHRLCQNQLILEEDEDGDSIERSDHQQRQHLSQNIRFVIGGQLEVADAKPMRHPLEHVNNYHSEGEEDDPRAAKMVECNVTGSTGSEMKDAQRVAVKLDGMLTRTTSADCSDSSAIGSSSDSGVFAHCGSSSSSTSSSSSGSSLTIDMVSTPRTSQSNSSRSSSSAVSSCNASVNRKCSCNSLYENKLDELAMIQEQKQRSHLTHLVSSTKERTKQATQFKREHFEFGQCALDWYMDSHEQYHKNKSVALISAGMTTGSDKKYVTDTVRTLHQLGYEVCVFIRRGVGGLKLNSTKFFSPSKWHDFEAAILSIKKQRPDCRLVAVGFSFGSIELCRYLSMSGERSLVASALLISCPFDPEAGGRNMRKRALNRKIDAYLAKNLGKQLYQALLFNDSTSGSCSDNERTIIEAMEEGNGGSADSKLRMSIHAHKERANSGTAVDQQLVHENYNGSLVDLSSLPKIKSLVDFEDNYNRVIQNYPNSDAYGADSRLNEQLAQIKTPTLCLSSEDDFMAPFKLLPIKQIEANENLCMILTKRGGHMAFIDGLIWPKKPYFAQRIIQEYMKLSSSDNIKNNRTSINKTTL